MNAGMIIEEIKQLPPQEQARVVRFVHELEQSRRWTPEELEGAAAAMLEERDPEQARRQWERVAAGFYGVG